jgi:hypothetical protein
VKYKKPIKRDDSVGIGQLVWTFFVGLAVIFMLFQKGSSSPIREPWTLQRQNQPFQDRGIASPEFSP